MERNTLYFPWILKFVDRLSHEIHENWLLTNQIRVTIIDYKFAAFFLQMLRDCHDSDRVIVGLITTCVINAYHH